MGRSHRWIVVGAGASGMAAAFFLEQLGIKSILLERDGTPGGRMGTVRLGERSLDCGGKNIGRRYTLFRRFAASLGSHPFEYFGLNSSQAVDGRLKTFDGSARWRTMADLVRGVPLGDALRFGRLLCRVKAQETAGYLGSGLARRQQQYDDLPLSHYFSPAFCSRIVRPMTVRMNGAEPDEVYMGTFPSNVRMLLDTYEQFARGLAPLLGDFERRYDVRLHTTTEGLVVERGRVTGVRVRNVDGSLGEVRGAGVILATPSAAAAALAEPVLPGLARQLRSIAYYPVSLIVAEYERPVFNRGVRAVVFGEDEILSNAGAYGVDDLHLVRYTFSGRAYRRSLTAAADPEALLRSAEASLSRHVPLAERARRFVFKHFDPGLCAYTPHHAAFLARMRDEIRIPGLHLTGDYLQGASIEACFRAASACVARLARHEYAQPVEAGPRVLRPRPAPTGDGIYSMENVR